MSVKTLKTLAEHRCAAGMSQSQLSEKSGVSLRTIQAIENRERSIGTSRLATVISLAEALNITVDQLAGYMGEHDGKMYYIGDFEQLPENDE